VDHKGAVNVACGRISCFVPFFLMLYDRPYMRQPAGYRRKIPMMGWILIVNAAVFILQNILQLFFGMDGLLDGPSVVQGGLLPDWFALTEPNLKEFKIWTLLTYSLFHGSLFHLIANFLLIFFIGRMVETMIGEEGLLKLYLLSVLGGGLFWAAVHWTGSSGLVIGASGGALGILIYFCLRNPNEPITLLLFFVIPVTVLPKWIGWGVLGLAVFGLAFSELGPGADRIAHSAHLGGIVAGFLFFKYEGWFRGISFPRIRLGKGSENKKPQPRYRVNVKKSSKSSGAPTKGKDLREEVDRILDKINSSGFGSLTDDEKETLNRAKEMLGKG